MIYWAPFLHFYQPPTQYHTVLDKICKESYLPLLKVFKDHPEAKLTINICGALTQMLGMYGYGDIITSFRELGLKNQLEFVESSKFHAILPLIPQEEIIRQIKLNHKTNLYFFKDAYKPKGFFPPEMCYSDESACAISKMGYEWIISSGISCQEAWPLDVIYKSKLAGNMKVFFRDDIISNRISFKAIDAKGFIQNLMELSKSKKDIYVITAMDAETFGHHIPRWEKLFLGEFFNIIGNKKAKYQVRSVTISELLKKFPVTKGKPPIRSSWSTTKEDIQKGNFYPLWKDPSNKIHSLQWEHLNIALLMLQEANKRKDNEKSEGFFEMAREIMDEALHSCQFWWANKNRWNINLINKGLILQEESLLNAYNSINLSKCGENEKKIYYNEVIKARGIAGKIRDEILGKTS